MNAIGAGLLRLDRNTEQVLDAWYPVIETGETRLSDQLWAAAGRPGESATVRVTADKLVSALGDSQPVQRLGRALVSQSQGHEIRLVLTALPDTDVAPADVADVFLRLHLLSSRLARPHDLSLDGIFGLLATVVWTDRGPFTPEEFEERRAEAFVEGSMPEVRAVDKFPRMVDYVIPSGVRIAQPGRVRLGAHLGEGTVVMHEGFVNYNAGTLGQAMVEGRISAGVVVGNGSDIGGGASIMGTLSGGGKEVIRVGEHCLLGANSGLGISLGDRCTVEAGLYVTAGTKVSLASGEVVKAAALSGHNDVLFRRNSQTGAVEALSKRNDVQLNPALH